MERKYSVVEIDKMRYCVCQMFRDLPGADAEVLLRTYMLNGTEPAELVEPAIRTTQEYLRRRSDKGGSSDGEARDHILRRLSAFDTAT